MSFSMHNQWRLKEQAGEPKWLIIQSYYLPLEIWIMVSCPLNTAYFEITGQMPDFHLYRTLNKRARKIPSNIPPYVLAAEMDYNIQAIDY